MPYNDLCDHMVPIQLSFSSMLSFFKLHSSLHVISPTQNILLLCSTVYLINSYWSLRGSSIFISLPLLGLSWCLYHSFLSDDSILCVSVGMVSRQSRWAREGVEIHKYLFKPLLGSSLLSPYWTKQVTWRSLETRRGLEQPVRVRRNCDTLWKRARIQGKVNS